MQNVIMLSDVILSVAVLNVVMLSVLAPNNIHYHLPTLVLSQTCSEFSYYYYLDSQVSPERLGQ